MQAVIMVAGKSTRTYPLTLTRPKPLLPFMNRPLIEHSLDQMVGIFDKVILIVGYMKESIEQVMGDDYRGIKIVYQEQKEQLGTGHAILQAKSHIRGRFVAMNGDDLFARQDLERLVKLENGALVKRVKDPSQYGVYKVDEQNRVLELVEKPQEFVSDLVNIGCYSFTPDIFTKIEHTKRSVRGEIEIVDAILETARETEFKVLPIQGFWLPTGFAWDLLKHQEKFMPEMTESLTYGEIEPGAKIHGVVQIGKNSTLKSGAYIEGPVIIGENCVIGPNCYIRGNTSIGNNCRIGHGVEIKNSILMDNSVVSHLCYVGDTVIGTNCNLGGGTITANKRHDDEPVQSMIKGQRVNTERLKLGAIISDGSQTGIHTSIYPGRKLWPGMTTLPGELVKKDIMPDENKE
jgi:UDP-N-acetylglucosamine diphosphorylase / glucose-1-phosphate thymidylyltransferase / UDP-N-acetylgalactosamine diphosphorylase / glucosamine-1-phosphate N-acetyltransferase / galactosamine-1-phosphate N-acetyltransferase